MLELAPSLPICDFVHACTHMDRRGAHIREPEGNSLCLPGMLLALKTDATTHHQDTYESRAVYIQTAMPMSHDNADITMYLPRWFYPLYHTFLPASASLFACSCVNTFRMRAASSLPLAQKVQRTASRHTTHRRCQALCQPTRWADSHGLMSWTSPA